MIRHLGIFRSSDGSGDWITAYADGTGWRVLDGGASRSLQVLVEDTLRQIKSHPTADFSFSTRPAATVLRELPDTSDGLRSAAPGASITLLLPEGQDHEPSRWNRIWRDHRGGLTTPGKSSRFMVATLLDQVSAYFTFGEGFKGFERAAIVSELWIRRSWRGTELLPEAFPAPVPFPVTPPEVVERRRSKAAQQRRQERQRANARGEVSHAFDQRTGRTFDGWDRAIDRGVVKSR
jgi:hypothetical protein